MDRQTYDAYLRLFNARDYEGLLDWFAPQFEIRFAGHCLSSRTEVKAFYRFLHEYLREEIFVDRFVGDERTVALEVRVQLTGLKAPEPGAAKAAGFEGLMMPPPGAPLVIPQFIHYHLEAGKFRRAVCAIV